MEKLSNLIKRDVNLQSHIESRTGLNFVSEGTWLKHPKCPFCGRKNCLKIKRETPDRFTCFACDSQKLLSVIDFEIKLQGCETKQAISYLSQMYGLNGTQSNQSGQDDSLQQSPTIIQHDSTNGKKNGIDNRKLAKQIWEASQPPSKEQAQDILSRRHFGKIAKQGSLIIVANSKINEYDGESWLIIPQVHPQNSLVGIHKILISDVHTKKDIGEKLGLFLLSTTGKHKKICIVVESFFNGIALASLGYSVFITYGVENKKALQEWLPNIKEKCDRVLLWFDRGVEAKQEKLCSELVLNGIWWEASRQDRFDINDLLQESDTEFTKKVEEYIANANPKCPKGLIGKEKSTATIEAKIEKLQVSPKKPRGKTLKSLMEKQFPPLKWIVKDVLTEGAYILAGKPKMGKSALALCIALSVACGGVALAKIRVEKGDVLYLALEDGERRLKDRIEKILMETGCPDGFYYDTEWANLEKGGLLALEEWLKAYPQARLVVVDTLAKVRPAQRPGESIYDRDYNSVQGLKKLADTYRVAILIIHHTRKADASDAMETISGSFGLSGGVDGTLVLKRERGKADAFLSITGKEIEEKDIALQFKFPCWEILGNAEEFRLSQERQAIISILKEANCSLSPKEIQEAFASKGIKRTAESIRYLLYQMVRSGEVRCIERGKYSLRDP